MHVFDKNFDIEGRYKRGKMYMQNSTIANHTVCGKKNVHKVLIIYLLKARPDTV